MNNKMVKKLMKFFKNPTDLETFLNTPYDDLFIYHFSFGTWIRNNILYEKKDFLKQCEKIGVNVDDLSNSMIYNFYIKLKHKD